MNKELLDVKQIQKIQIEILRHFAAFCRENNIEFYLSNGTLLGAVKYKGFIPWDDDIDVLVPRKDYDRLLEIYHDSKRYVLFTCERVSGFNYPFAKLCDITTVKEEFNINNGTQLGLEIDVFPLDCWAPDKKSACEQAEKIRGLMQTLGYIKTIKFVPNEDRSWFGKLARKIAHPFFRLIGTNYYCEKIRKEALRYNDQSNPEYMGSVLWPAYDVKEVVPADVFSDSVDVVFEGEKYPAPIGYDTYLRCLYGDYRQDPPAEKQKTHHNFIAYFKDANNS